LRIAYRGAPTVIYTYASLSRGFNSGNYNGGAFLFQGEASFVNPEILKSYEVGVKADITPRLRINVNAFKYDFKDMQVFITVASANNVFQELSNAAAASLYGGELELAWRPVSALTVQLGSGYTHSRFDHFDNLMSGDLTGKELPSAPKLNANGLVRYEAKLAQGTLALQADAKYQARQFFNVNDDPLLQQGAYTTWNARLSYTFAGDRLTASLWGKNLGNRAYLVGAYDLSAYGFDQYNFGEPRTYGLTLQMHIH
jgi:iron complex outermembrane receptor protein